MKGTTIGCAWAAKRPHPFGHSHVIALRDALGQNLSGAIRCKCGRFLWDGLVKWHTFYAEFYCDCNPTRAIYRVLVAERSNETDSIYFVEAPSLAQIKIGVSENVKKRLSRLTKAIKCPARLLCHISVDRFRAVSIERAIHQKFAHLRVHGEWFRDSTDLRAFIEDASSGYDDFQRH